MPDAIISGITRLRMRLAELPRAVCLLLAAALSARGDVSLDLARPGPENSPTPVSVSLYLVDLRDVSGASQTFLADVVVVAEWRDPRLAGRWPVLHGAPLDEVWNPHLQLGNQQGVEALLPNRVEIDPSGRVRWRQRWLGNFTANLNLREFPLDRHRFRIHVVSLGYTRDDVRLEVRGTRAPELSITDWEVGPIAAANADYLVIPGEREIAGVEIAWDVHRQVRFYAIETILPLVLIVLMGWMALWVDASLVAARVSVAMTTMLTLISYRFSLGRSIPRLSYLTRFDYFMLESTLLIFTILVLVPASAYLVNRNRLPLAQRIDRWARLFFPVVFAAVCWAAWWG